MNYLSHGIIQLRHKDGQFNVEAIAALVSLHGDAYEGAVLTKRKDEGVYGGPTIADCSLDGTYHTSRGGHAKGFYIVDGQLFTNYDKVVTYMMSCGFSKQDAFEYCRR